MKEDFTPENRENHSRVHKLPEFIIIDENDSRFDPFPSGLKGPTRRITSVPFKIRLLCFFIGCLTLLWTIGALIGFILTGPLSYLALRTNITFNELTKRYWKFIKGGSAITTGLWIALFSPYLGFVMILSYFLLQDSSWQKGSLASLVRSQFNDYLS